MIYRTKQHILAVIFLAMQLVATAASDALAQAVHIADKEQVRALLQSTDVDPNKQVCCKFLHDYACRNSC
jgi:uncharacterized membrane protein YvbJ